jgi:O-antigen/teichoic acid export membrane protein
MTGNPEQPRGGLHRIVGQGTLLAGGFAAAQALSLGRNALLGYWLAKGDFGIAALITVTLALVETLGDIGADRLLLQAPDGAERRMLDAAHALQLMRGATTTALIFALAGPAAGFFQLAHWQPLFQAIAIVPMIKGFLHLDHRLAQRDLDNRPFVAIEVGSQALAFMVTPVVLVFEASPWAVFWTALTQATVAVALSHRLAASPWQLGLDRPRLARFVRFGWPIWASAIPLVAVYQLDRMIVGRFFGMEVLAGYTAAFMLAMIPGLLAARIAQSLMLPLLARSDGEPNAFRSRYLLLLEGTVLLAAGYLVLFFVAGPALVATAFGPSYRGLGPIIGLLATMWSLRMVQAVPGMALLALGCSKPLLWAGLVRAAAVPVAALAAWKGYGIEVIAALGILGEVASLVCIAACLARVMSGLGGATLLRTALLLPAGGVGLAAAAHLATSGSRLVVIAIAAAVATASVILAVALLPHIRGLARHRLAAFRVTVPVAPS